MASTHFTTGTTITSEWLNDVNDAVYEGNITAEGVQYTPPFTGGVTETVEAKLAQTVSVKDFGAVGDGVTDDTQAFQNAINSVQTTKSKLYIPYGNYIFGSQLVFTIPVDVESDAGTSMRWTNTSSSGILLDFRSVGGAGGVKMKFPGLYSPGVDSDLQYPGYPASWSTADRSGNGIVVKAGSRISIDVQYLLGWDNAIVLQATYDGTYGAQAPLNYDVTVNTIDICGGGIVFDTGPANAFTLAANVVVANTVFAKYPVRFITSNGSTTAMYANTVKITGQAFTNEVDGAIFYQTGTYSNANTVDVAWGWAGFSGYDSPVGTPVTFSSPYVAGDQPLNGITADGNTNLGYFGGDYNDINVGSSAYSYAGYGSAFSSAGISLRVKDAGQNNKILTRYLSQPAQVAFEIVQTQGEANYNGGVGGAGLAKRTLVFADVPTLAPGASADFWFYHSLLSGGNSLKFIQVEPIDADLTLSGLTYAAMDNSGTNNREVKVTFKNNTSSSIAGRDYTFWLEVMN